MRGKDEEKCKVGKMRGKEKRLSRCESATCSSCIGLWRRCGSEGQQAEVMTESDLTNFRHYLSCPMF